MRFDISRSLNGEQIIYIARDANGIVRLRANSLEELQEAIKEYKPALKETPKKEITVKAHEEENLGSDDSQSPLSEIIDKDTSQSEGADLAAQLISEPPTEEKAPEPKKEFFKSDLKEKVEEKKKRTSKGSFWDKLK